MYVVFKVTPIRKDRFGNKQEIYWSGNYTDSSGRERPRETNSLERANQFETAREAYDAAGKAGLNWWRVGSRCA